VSNYPTCKFHPDRRAGVVCQRCDSPICPACMHQASVGFHCPDCVRAGKQRVVQGRQAFGVTTPVLTAAIVGINVLVYLLQMAAGNVRIGPFVENRGIVNYGLNAYDVSVHHEWYRIITAGFIHASIFHVAINMFALWMIGRIVEAMVGRLRFALIYAVSLVAGSVGALVLSPDSLTVGASGAIFGLFAALVILFRARGIDLWRSGLAITILINFVFTLAVPNISLGGHAGGFIGGLVATWLLVELPRRVRNRHQPIVLAALLIPALFVVGVLVATNYTGPLPTG
jgi:membrane associated rhomboid family serine protease